MTEKIYRNRDTGEVTTKHIDAIHWYRDGHPVDIMRGDRVVLSWEVLI